MKKIILLLIIVVFYAFLFFQNKKTEENSVSFASWGSQSEVKILNQILSDFENETNIKVNFIHIPQNYFQKIHLLFASNLEPDVIFINNHYLKMYAEANRLEELTNLVNEEEYHKVALDCLKNNGKLFAIPRDISALVLYRNKNIFKQQKVNTNKKISTINELLKITQKLKTENNYVLNYEEDPLFWLYYLAANGGGAISDDGKKIIINNKESIDALNLYSNLINEKNYIPRKAQIGSMTSAQMFITGKLAMYLGGRWMIPKFTETIEFDWDIVEFPSSEKNKVYVDASGWAISKKTNNKENAIKLVKYLSSENSVKKLKKSGLITPARKIQQDEETKIFTDMLVNTKPTPTNKFYGKINDMLKENVTSIISGEKEAQEAFNERTIRELESLL